MHWMAWAALSKEVHPDVEGIDEGCARELKSIHSISQPFCFAYATSPGCARPSCSHSLYAASIREAMS